MILGINTTLYISKLSQISLAYGLVKLRMTILKYHGIYAKYHYKSCDYLYKYKVCTGKKPTVSVTYENERISIKSSS